MTLADVAQMFHRAMRGTTHKGSLFFLFCVLFLSGFLMIFFQALALMTAGWLGNALTLFPLFLVLGLIVSAEVVLIKLYVSRGPVIPTLLGSWRPILRVATYCLPLVILFVALWICSGLFLLLRMIPYLGPPLGVLLSFAPFLFHLAILVLALCGVYLSFVVCPTLVLTNKGVRKSLKERLVGTLFYDLLLLMVAAIPLWMIFRGLLFAANLTFSLEAIRSGSLEHVLQSFFMMIPFVACLTPPTLFFFNFAAEAAQFRATARA